MMPPDNPQSPIPNPQSRYALCALLLLLSAFAMVHLSLRLMGQAHYHSAREVLRDGYFGLARAQLEKAEHEQPGDPAIHKALGRVYFELGALKPNAQGASGFARKSRESYTAAAAINPLDAQSAYGIARAEVRLEELYRYLHPENKDTPHNPAAHFEEAIRLRPNGILYRYANARYLHRKGRNHELLSSIRELARIYPPSYYYLRKEAFWSPTVKEACGEGLEAAVNENISPRSARMALSSMAAGDQQWPAAILLYKEALRYKAFDNRPGNYIHLGGLYLKNGQFIDARPCFFRALNMSRSRDREMARLYHLYRKQKQSDRFEQFYRDADRTLILPAGAEIILARTLMDLKQYNQAGRLLTELVHKRPDAAAYYWLARIAQAEKEWDAMELAIQKATVLEPENSRYHSLFSWALKRKKKFKRAAEEAALARKFKK
jgi:tetratricopeptide (TPR) repeat protein